VGHGLDFQVGVATAGQVLPQRAERYGVDPRIEVDRLPPERGGIGARRLQQQSRLRGGRLAHLLDTAAVTAPRGQPFVLVRAPEQGQGLTVIVMIALDGL
jgi:hypothetical protein